MILPVSYSIKETWETKEKPKKQKNGKENDQEGNKLEEKENMQREKLQSNTVKLSSLRRVLVSGQLCSHITLSQSCGWSTISANFTPVHQF